MNFKEASGDLLGLATDGNHVNIEWRGGGRVIFSMERRGNGLSCHFASDRNGLRHIKQAINEFCDWAFSSFEWCKMIFAVIEKPSVERLVLKCGFNRIGELWNMQVYTRRK